jgi:hypothetical protein
MDEGRIHAIICTGDPQRSSNRAGTNVNSRTSYSYLNINFISILLTFRSQSRNHQGETPRIVDPWEGIIPLSPLKK